MKILTTVILLILPSFGFGFTKYPAYIDNVEDDDAPITVFKTPGQNWQHCKKELDPATKTSKCVEAVGWPGRDAKITVLSPPKKVKTRDPVTGDEVMEEYSQIEFEYSRKVKGRTFHQKGVGYIQSYYLSRQKTKAFYASKDIEKENCPPDVSPQANLKEKEKTISALAKSVENFSVTQKAEALRNFVGICPLKPPTKLPKKIPSGNVYDAWALPELRKNPVPKMTKEDGTLMTQKDLISIDSLARTLYAELAGCYVKGLQYPMAVAKVIVNRSEDTSRLEQFTDSNHSSMKSPLAKVSTSPSQFIVWSATKHDGARNPTLHRGLCPPVGLNQPFWKENQASPLEADIWKNTLRIATEAVLHPKQFKKRTAQIDGYFYTAGLAEKKEKYFIKNMTRSYPSIEGRRVDNGACVELWKE